MLVLMSNRGMALANGQTKYQGKPCKNGHSGIRYTKSGNCIICDRIICLSRKHLYKENSKYSNIFYNYGITKEEYELILISQNYCCKLCNNKLDMGFNTHLDHCKITKKIRGILCNHCNIGIGHLQHNPELLRKAALYCEAVND